MLCNPVKENDFMVVMISFTNAYLLIFKPVVTCFCNLWVA